MQVADQPGVLAAIATAFAEEGVSIQTVRQDGRGADAHLLVRTHKATDAALAKNPPDFATYQTKQAQARELVAQALGQLGQ